VGLPVLFLVRRPVVAQHSPSAGPERLTQFPLPALARVAPLAPVAALALLPAPARALRPALVELRPSAGPSDAPGSPSLNQLLSQCVSSALLVASLVLAQLMSSAAPA
jgi:hypothetical protein